MNLIFLQSFTFSQTPLVVIGAGDSVYLDVTVRNVGEEAFDSQLIVDFHQGLEFEKVEKILSVGIQAMIVLGPKLNEDTMVPNALTQGRQQGNSLEGAKIPKGPGGRAPRWESGGKADAIRVLNL